MVVLPTITASRSIRGLMSTSILQSVQSHDLVIAEDTDGRRHLQAALTNKGNDGQPDSAFPLNACQGDCDRGMP
jgi:hypothetical protein